MHKFINIAHIHVWDNKNKGDVGIVIAVKELLNKYFVNIKFSDFPVETLKRYNKNEIYKINNADILIIGGGGIFYRYFLPFNKKTINSINIPIIIFGVGYIREIGSRVLNNEEKDSIYYLIKKSKLIGVRDYYTKKILINLGADKSKIELTGDPAIFLSEIKEKKFNLNKKINIGLNLNYSGWLGFGKWEKDILNSYEKIAYYFINKYNAQIYYLLHHPDEINILKKLNIKNLIIIDYKPNEQKYIYSKLNLIIGMMLHSCVFAFGAQTPEINLAYDLRNKNFAKFINCPELFVPLEGLKKNNLYKKAKTIFLNQKKYKLKFINRKVAIEKNIQGFIKEIKLIIKYEK